MRGGKSLGKIAGKVGGGSLLKTAGKMGGKSLLKKIPIAGAFIGAGLAIDRAMEGDWMGAGGEALSGLASTVPLYGTAASVGIDAALAARDLSRGASGSSAQSSGVSIGEHGEKTLHVPAIYADSIIIKRSQDITESAF